MHAINLDNNKVLKIIPDYGWYITTNNIYDDDIYKLTTKEKITKHFSFDRYLDNFNIYISGNCNGKCLYCYQNAPEKERIYDLSIQEINNYLNYIESIQREGDNIIKNKSIELFGGEPLIRRDIYDILDILLEKQYTVKIATNGTLPIIQSSRMEKYIKNPNIHIRISLDGHTKNIHEKYRTKGSFDRIIDNIRYLVKNNSNLSVKSIITDDNFLYLPNILDFFKNNLGVRLWNYNALYNLSYSKLNKVNSNITHYDLVKELTDEKYSDYWDMFRQTPLAQMLNNIFVKKRIQYLRTYTFINYDRKIYLNDQLINNEYCVGNLNDIDFSKLKNIVKRIELNRNSCISCLAKDYCFLGNYGELYDIDKSLENEFPTCNSLRSSIIYLMSLEEKGVEILKKIISKR